MLKLYILNTFSEPFPAKCQKLNSFLKECNIKDLYATMELIIEFIFSDYLQATHQPTSSYLNLELNQHYGLNQVPFDINNNNFSMKQQQHHLSYGGSWPLKTLNRQSNQNGLEYNCIFNFLNTQSVFWLSIFKLDSVGAIFNVPCENLPEQLRCRIESGQSSLSNKLDSLNVLKLTTLEYYLLNFFMVLLDNKTSSRRAFNEFYGNIELDSLYADLLNDYLAYFLPISQRDVSFPTFVNLNTNQKQSMPQTTSHHSLFKRNITKMSDASTSPNQHLPQKHQQDNFILDDSASFDRAGDIRKIESFLRLINECLILPLNHDAKQQQQQQSNLETIFALSMILRHSHLFMNAAAYFHQTPIDTTASSSQMGKFSSFDNLSLYNTKMRANKYANGELVVDEFRKVLFKNYWRKSFNKFFEFHFEHWSLTPSIKWIIELWLTYVQSWKFVLVDESQMQSTTSMQLAVITNDFIRDNYLIFNDIYQLIIKRYFIIDLTNANNLQLLNQILMFFLKEKDLIKKNDLLYSNFQSKYFQISNKQELQNTIRNNLEFRQIYNTFVELEKPIHSYRPLVGVENFKMISNFYETLLVNKKMLSSLLAKKTASESNFISSIYSFLFETQSENQINNLSIDELNNLIKILEDSLSLIQRFYKSNSSYPYVQDLFAEADEDEAIASHSIKKESYELNDLTKKLLVDDYELTPNGLRLTPKSRFEMINALKKPTILNVYDPDSSQIGDMEVKWLVYLLKSFTDQINNKFSSEFESLYNRDDIAGKLTRKILYGPATYEQQFSQIGKDPLVKNLLSEFDDKHDQSQIILNKIMKPPRMSLRVMASYKFLIYFVIFSLIARILIAASWSSSFMLVGTFFFMYTLCLTS